ncbi:MAG: hypothetical protein DMD86_17745, partial [Candidatus Rokuibacteriota bacterium]
MFGSAARAQKENTRQTTGSRAPRFHRITSNRPVEDWGKLLGDTAAVAALLDRLLHHAHVLTC